MFNLIKKIVFSLALVRPTLVCTLMFLTLNNLYAYEDLDHIRIHSVSFDVSQNIPEAHQTLEDKYGFLWISSPGLLQRYNGYSSQRFPLGETEGIATTPYLFKQKNGTLWAIDSRLHRFNYETETFTSFDIMDNQNMSSIAEATEDANGNLWIAGYSLGIIKFNTATNTVEKAINTLDNKTRWAVQSIAFDKDKNQLWVISEKGLHIYSLKNGNIKQIKTPIDKLARKAYSYGQNIICDSKQSCWLSGAGYGLLKINKNTFKATHYTHEPKTSSGLSTNSITSIMEDSKGYIWIGTDKKGVNLYNPKTDSFISIRENIESPDQMPPSTIDHILEDSQGSIWISANKYGIRRISPQFDTIKRFTNDPENKNSLAFNNVLDFLEMDDGKIWIATDGGGLDRYDPATKEFIHLRHDHDNIKTLGSDAVIGLALDHNGFIWAGTWGGGLNRINPNTFEVKRFQNNLNLPKEKSIISDNIFDIEHDGKTGLWLSAWNFGIQHYDIATNTFTSYLPSAIGGKYELQSLNIYDFEYDKEGILWIAGSGGIEKYDPKNNTFLQVIQGTEYYVKDLLFVDNLMYAANTSGLIEYNKDTKEIRTYYEKDGLSNNSLLSLSITKNNKLWISTSHGLTIFDRNDKTFERYYEQDGLAGNKFNNYANLIDKNGILYLGGKNGISIIDPNKLPRNTRIPPTYISNITMINKKFEKNKIKQTLFEKNDKENIFPYNENSFIFNFFSLNLIFPEKNYYKYRLKEAEKKFTYVNSEKRFAEFTNLSPGEYTFEVFSSNNNDVWDKKGDQFKIIIKKPWFKTPIAIIGFILGTIGIIQLLLHWRLAQNKKKQQELTTLVNKKTHELNSLNQNLEKRVAIRTKELSVEVEERKLAEAKLFHMAFHDALTGLPNRPWLSKKLDSLIDSISQNPNQKFGLMFMDGDKFKQINDTYGHIIGDKILKASTARLTKLLKNEEHAIRLGGDEFTILLDSVANLDQIEVLAKKIVNAFKEPFSIEGNTIYFNVSIGILLCDQQYKNTSAVLRDADFAMYEAKNECKGYYKVFDQAMRDNSKEIAALESDLKLALQKNQFSLEFQPITSINKKFPFKVEVLLRWNHPEKGIINPNKFISIAEESGLMIKIGRWVMQEIFELLEREELINIQFSINVSASELRENSLLKYLRESLKKYNIEPSKLIFEATEATLMENSSTMKKTLMELNDLGIILAIDDFGKGYTSLSYLKELPIQLVKIDQTFTRSITKQDRVDGKKIVNATIILAHSLKMQIIAQGVENAAQQEILENIDCDYIQGFHISQPLSFEELKIFIANH